MHVTEKLLIRKRRPCWYAVLKRGLEGAQAAEEIRVEESEAGREDSEATNMEEEGRMYDPQLDQENDFLTTRRQIGGTGLYRKGSMRSMAMAVKSVIQEERPDDKEKFDKMKLSLGERDRRKGWEFGNLKHGVYICV